MITVLVAAYQGEIYLEEQLDSILNQTYSEMQVLISDDGSTDGTWELARQYAARYPGKVRCLRHPREDVAEGPERRVGARNAGTQNACVLDASAKNTGDQSVGAQNTGDQSAGAQNTGDQSAGEQNTGDQSAGTQNAGDQSASAQNSGSPAVSGIHPAAANFFWLLSRAEGDYIMLSDQDDVWREDKAERMLFHMKKAEEKWGAETPILLYSDARVVDSELNEIAPSFLKYQHINPSRNSLNEILVENPATGGAMMFNAALLPYVAKAPRQCMMHDWWIALAASCFGHVECVKEPLYSYRQHGRNTLGAKKTGSLEDLKERVKRGEQVRERYDRMFTQASCFLDQFGSRLTKEQVNVLRAYLSLPYQRLRGRMKTVRRYHFHKSSRIQTVAQCFTIPRR